MTTMTTIETTELSAATPFEVYGVVYAALYCLHKDISLADAWAEMVARVFRDPGIEA